MTIEFGRYYHRVRLVGPAGPGEMSRFGTSDVPASGGPGGSVQIRRKRCSPARRVPPDPYDSNESESVRWEGRGVCADSGHFGSQAPAYRPGVVGRPGRLIADRALPCPIRWDAFGCEPGLRPGRAHSSAGRGARPGPQISHARDPARRAARPGQLLTPFTACGILIVDRGYASVQGNRTRPSQHPRTRTTQLRMDHLPADGPSACRWTT